MGPAAWAAVGRALGLALVSSLFSGKNSIQKIAFHEIKKAINSKEFKMAKVLIRDMAYRHKESFKKFMTEYKDVLPEEFLSEFSDYL